MPGRRRCSACCAPHVRRLPIRHVRLNVIPDAQGRGVGRFAVESVAAAIRRRDGTQMHLTRESGEDGPEGFFQKLGFSSPVRRARGRRSACWI
ncbi:GNAT family N-acetyltransferase [Streptomyces ferrugineus]|uniref:GNAT family N-acetyltransferase n=1 Tax=Streptomyces ferrugineus TaxID=1413221 RepID=UPI003899A60F